jgi:hemoglobin
MKTIEWIGISNRTASQVLCLGLVAAVALTGCGTEKATKKKDDFFTSGSRDADQRASQTMAKHEQKTGEGEGKGEKGAKKAEVAGNGARKPGEETNKAAQVEGKLALYDRLGGESGLSNIVADFLPRALNDPRVNWERKSASKNSFWRKRKEPVWSATPESTATLRKHMVQFLALATGGPAHYEGKEIKPTHASMAISNPEFDAVVGDLKASLDKLQVPNKEQKELLAIVESTRPQVVTQR